MGYKCIPIITLTLFVINAVQLITISPNTGNKTTAYIFGQLNTIVCVLLGVIANQRYHQIKRLICQHSDLLGLTQSNRRAAWLGYLVCSSYGIVAAFLQEYQYLVNSVGILIFFGFCTWYTRWQYEISFQVQSYIGSMELTCCQMNLAVICKWMLYILFTIQSIWVFLMFKNDERLLVWITFFGVLANGCKLIFVMTFAIYMLTFRDIFNEEKPQVTV